MFEAPGSLGKVRPCRPRCVYKPHKWLLRAREPLVVLKLPFLGYNSLLGGLEGL